MEFILDKERFSFFYVLRREEGYREDKGREGGKKEEGGQVRDDGWKKGVR